MARTKKLKNSSALSSVFNTAKMEDMQKRIEINSEVIERYIKGIVTEYCAELDKYILHIKRVVGTDDVPTEALDNFVLRLPVLIYFAGEALENVGIQEDISTALKMEIYNHVFNDTEGTIADKTAMAELATQTEFVNNVIYTRAYKKIKLRMEMATELLQSIKKVVSRRISEYELSKYKQDNYTTVRGGRSVQNR